MQDNGGEWMSRKRNPPAASNMGGMWDFGIPPENPWC